MPVLIRYTPPRLTKAQYDQVGEGLQGKGQWPPDGLIAHVGFGPDGDMRVLLDEGDPVKVDALEQAFVRNNVSEDVLFATGQGVAPWMASVTFGGPDLRTVYIGSLKGRRVPYFRAPVAGLPMVHWHERR